MHNQKTISRSWKSLAKKLEELKESLETKKFKPDLSANPERDESNKIQTLESRVKELEEMCEEYKSKLDTSDSMIEDLNEGYDNLSLRAKIVSYFSMMPLSVLILAVLVAFYPILAKITATDL